MRISDWSSDVCSSDLKQFGAAGGAELPQAPSASLISSPTAATASTPAAHRPANHSRRRGRLLKDDSSMIALLRVDLAAEDPIGIGGVGEDDGNQHRCADQQEAEALVRPGRLPDGDAGRDDEGIEADADAREAQHEERERRQERLRRSEEHTSELQSIM